MTMTASTSAPERLPFLPINTVDSMLTDNYEDLVSPDNYKRAVQTRPPPSFTVSLKPSSSSSSSIQMLVRSTNDSSFVITRTWSDCLYFQSTLSSLYTFLARLKKEKLRKGLGGGVTGDTRKMAGAAASFESLPPGPDPQSISLDLWEALPRLPRLSSSSSSELSYVSVKSVFSRKSKKGEEEGKRKAREEWIRFLMVLFEEEEEVPVLVREVREQRKVTDFFGMWMRDVKNKAPMEQMSAGGMVKVVTREARLRRRDSTKSPTISVRKRANTLSSSTYSSSPPSSSSSSPHSFTSTSFSSSTSTSSSPATITIKASLSDSSTTILLRLPSSTPLCTILTALHTKFLSFPLPQQLGPLCIVGVHGEEEWRDLVEVSAGAKVVVTVSPL